MMMRALLAVAMLLPFSACDEDLAFYIYQNQVPKADCFIDTNTDVYRPQGVLDISLGKGYHLFPLVLNDMPASAEELIDTADPNTLHLREYRVKLQVSGLEQKLDDNDLEFFKRTSGTLKPGDKRASAVEVIPGDLVQKIKLKEGARANVLAEVVVVADSSQGVVSSQPFYYPVELCDGCLVVVTASCPTDKYLDNSDNVCLLPQDDPLYCCKHPQLGFICPAKPPTSEDDQQE